MNRLPVSQILEINCSSGKHERILRTMPKDYTKTLNLPNTSFAMRANLPLREGEMLAHFDEIDLYHKMLRKNEGKKPFVLHDGPPFSNGNIHMGTAMNKILKDFIVKYHAMTGYYTPYVPGWDNHGMPIESAIIKKNKLDRKKMTVPEFRRACESFAADFVSIQREQFRRLGVTGDWENPYLTMKPEFEARELRVFGKMYEKGYIYKGLKPVYWCPHDETALAEAEIDYKDVPCTSIYVKFRTVDDKGLFRPLCGNLPVYFIIWTTTTWTLPGNLAIALHPAEEYALIRAGECCYVTAMALAEKTMREGGIEEYEILGTFRGKELEFAKARHPFLERDSVIVNADYVTMDSGTGCVHTAPGFGADDYITCRRYNMDIIVPVDDRGYQTEDAGKYAGLYYEKSNEVILADMKESGALFASEEFVHSYPHCWRCKHPIIFRATPQWFCSVAAFRDEAIKACADVEWIPAWGGERMVQMIRERADWCISRQRHWGLPIPVFYCADCGQVICNETTIDYLSKLFGEHGSNVWFEKSAEELMPQGYVCEKCGGTHFTKETDTLDGWFDSGSSHFSVLENKPGMTWPADLYLEGADQYRGWFQSSMLTAVAAKGQGAPYRSVLTHGWVVDGEGKQMHKSLGNAVAAEDVVKKYGADLLRLWVASSDYRVDVRVSDAIFKQLSDAYRKIRNTARILLADLGDDGTDFVPDRDLLPAEKLLPIDRWLLARLNRLIVTARAAYESYEFHLIYHAVYNFCTTELSKLYIDITKDRMYAELKDSEARRAAQTAMFCALDTLTRLIAPLLAFTADEIWQAMPHRAADNAEHVILNEMPALCKDWECPEIETHYENLFRIRDDVMKALETARADKVIGKSLDADLVIYADGENYALLDSFRAELPTLFIVSAVQLNLRDGSEQNTFCGESGLMVKVQPAAGERCDRCWNYSTECTPDEAEEEEENAHVCPRCAAVLRQIRQSR